MLKFLTALNGGLLERMRISSAGNVGIGTTGPLSKLDVNGGIAVGTYAGTATAPSNGLIVSGQVGIGTNGPNAGAILDLGSAPGAQSSLLLPTGTSGNRPGTVEGMLRYSSSPTKQVEAYVNGAWSGLLTNSSTITTYLGTATSAANPSRSGDATTGLFSAAASSVSLAVGGTEAFFPGNGQRFFRDWDASASNISRSVTFGRNG